jgi:hypothetical protein
VRKRWTFEEWMEFVDAMLEKKVGVGSSDLPDRPYTDWYEDGMTPGSAASKAAKDAGE